MKKGIVFALILVMLATNDPRVKALLSRIVPRREKGEKANG